MIFQVSKPGQTLRFPPALMALASGCFIISACQATVLQSQQAPSAPGFAASTVSLQKPLAYQTPELPAVKVQVTGQIQIAQQRVRVTVKLPPRPDSGFRTQALDFSTATQIAATLSDSYGRTYQPVGAISGLVNYPANGSITLDFNAVLPDQLIFLELQVRDPVSNLPQAELASVISHPGVTDTSGLINFQTTPAAKAIKALLSTDATRARAINLSALNTLVNTITGYSAGPPATYTTHPSLVNTALLASDLASTDPASLTAANYRLTGATVSLNISGLVGSDKLDVQITDAASAIQTNLANGTNQLVQAATPGTGLKVKVGATSGNSTQYILSVSPNNNLTLTNGTSLPVTIVATPATVTVDNLSATAAAIGSTLTINGSGFSTTLANNTVKFGSTVATVNSATASSLNVTVPAGISGSQPVTVEVGATTSNSSAFSVVPTISGLSATGGSTGDSLTISGTGFSTTLAHHTVRFGTSPATVTAASPTSLTVTLNEAPAGVANATVEVNGQTSNSSSFTRLPKLTSVTAAETVSGKAALVRGLTVTLNGSNFDPVATQNQVRLTLANSTLVTATPLTASATQLSFMVPAGVDFAGDVAVAVTSNSQTSNSLTAIVPSINLNFNGGFQ